jgi:UDP-glucose 4-epimerase
MAILVTGGMGFIGLHVIGQLLDAGEDVVCTWNRSWRVHESWAEEVGKRVIAERVDVAQPHDVMNATLKHKVNGVVHLASPVIGTSNVTQDYTTNLAGLVNAIEAANLAGVRRFTYVSSSTVYQGLKKGPYHEDEPLPLESKNPVEAFKKAGEIVAMHYADRLGMSLGIVRPRGVYGPMYYSMANLPSRLCHAAVKGTEPNYGPAGAPYADDGNDFSNVQDVAELTRIVHQAEKLPHRVYNAGNGSEVTVKRLVDAVKSAVPDAKIEMKPGKSPTNPMQPDNYLDISRAKQDFGWEPRFPIEKGIPDYISWLRTHPQ